MTVHPIPVVIAVRLVGADSHPHLRLSPEAGPVRSAHSDVRTKVGEIQLAVGAIKDDPGLLVAVLSILRG